MFVSLLVEVVGGQSIGTTCCLVVSLLMHDTAYKREPSSTWRVLAEPLHDPSPLLATTKMPILGCGIDVLSSKRLTELVTRRGAERLASRILSTTEHQAWRTISRLGTEPQLRFLALRRVLSTFCTRTEMQNVARRWTAKEAAYKALYPTYVASWAHLTVTKDGPKPSIAYTPVNTKAKEEEVETEHNAAAIVPLLPPTVQLHLSYTHDGGQTMAMVVAEMCALARSSLHCAALMTLVQTRRTFYYASATSLFLDFFFLVLVDVVEIIEASASAGSVVATAPEGSVICARVSSWQPCHQNKQAQTHRSCRSRLARLLGRLPRGLVGRRSRNIDLHRISRRRYGRQWRSGYISLYVYAVRRSCITVKSSGKRKRTSLDLCFFRF